MSIKKEKNCQTNMKYKFERKTLSFKDMFSEVIFYVNKAYLFLTYKKKKDIDKMAIELLSEN